MGDPRPVREPGYSRSQRQLRGRIGGLSLIATHGADNPNLRTARRAFLDRFLKEIDPSLPQSERLDRAETAKRLYMTKLSLKSSIARARRGRLSDDESPEQDH